ncbi:CLUMA_CG021509, isoform A [Clunio marinus]|uniref:CLUMA_CG021509, isoform A n=1 Tax=Clunio marinus TaxID=568069 RepID=A0A1J1J9K3_9DIPT|nr:CLUMA_CG021509, isoform A [Clunio marinus]
MHAGKVIGKQRIIRISVGKGNDNRKFSLNVMDLLLWNYLADLIANKTLCIEDANEKSEYMICDRFYASNNQEPTAMLMC